MIGTARIISDDMFGIADRLKGIDDSYFILYNYVKKRYEIHSSDQRGGTLALVVPYPELDARTVELVRSSRRERIDEIIKETEKHNAAAEKKAIENLVRKAAKESEYALGKL